MKAGGGGNAAAAKCDALLSPRSRAMDEWFGEWDKDGNGVITQDELAEGLQKLGLYLSLVS